MSWYKNRLDHIKLILSSRISQIQLSSWTEFKNDESGGILEAWIFVIFGLFILLVCFILLVPIDNMIASTMIEMGAPANPINHIRRMMAWGLGVMGAGLVIYGLMYAYKYEHDQGIRT